ncbi:related to RNA binding protein NRD1 protein [Rhynchosporium secalis]|uniref:Related to RNA binding protein NRD1 protein n=1 Tax=Rhynchosporium secalis TaxID=38038 RepID=A0A1E1MIG2_RHYSE|nr:related to RNA binding protein NRD1 protein [Rhynchosporium secalis]
MSSAVADLEASLQAMLSLKPPGVSGTRISSITALCTANVQSESVLIQKLYTHFKKAPGSHKLGVLYVVDSVVRKWTEQAKSAGQPINNSAQDGTFGAGVNRVKELLPMLMNDIIHSAPNDQKEKLRKLLDIWEKGQTFPLQMIASFKEQLSATNVTTTPPGSPPSDLQQSQPGQQPAPAPAAATRDTSSILAALSNIARLNAAAPANSNPVPPTMGSSFNVSNGHNNPAQQVPALNQLPYSSMPLPVNVPAPTATFAQQTQALNGTQAYASNNPYAGAPSVMPPAPLDPAVQQQLMLIKALSDQGLSADKIAGIIAAMGSQAPPLPGAGGIPPPLPLAAQNQNAIAQNSWGGKPDQSRDYNGYNNESIRSPQSRFQRRSRSRSPKPEWNARDSPASRRRDDQNFDYDRGSPGGNRDSDDRGRGGRAGGRGNGIGTGTGNGNEYRQRSPIRRGQSPSPPGSSNGPDKWVGHDSTIPRGSIKVLSRTLFVGGVTSSEHELRNLFAQFGRVQTCIVNKDKRHAFVKMITRQDAIAAKDAMEKNRTPDSQLRTRWGVGFGPRECSDYQTGVSIIPINKLTDADRKWMVSAEYGGSGGKPMESGMVVEEPDIEIGQGVSSKAISRRMGTDQGGHGVPKSNRGFDDEEKPRFRRGGDRDDHRNNDRKERYSNISGPTPMPPVPAFGMPGGFPFAMPTLPNGMPMFPPGFTFPGQPAPSQPPPPGHRN